MEEVKEYLREKKEFIFPLGICEQHSKHLPLNTDTVIAEYISDYLSHKCNILSAPALKYGVGLPRDLYFPGSTTMKFEDLKDTVSSIIEGWQLQGKGLLKSTPHR